MADDLVTRLRDEAEEKYFTHPSNLLRAAADYIELLEARVKELEDGLLKIIVALSDDGDING